MNNISQPRKFLFLGVGAIGTYIGTSLALAGQNVSFLERPEVAAKVRQAGLHLEVNGVSFTVPSPMIYDSIELALSAEQYDLAVLAVKSYDTQAVLQSIAPFIDQLPPFLCLQNGVENEEAITALLGTDRVIPGSVTTAVGRKDAGDVVVEKLRGVGIALSHPLSRELVTIMNTANLRARGYPHPAGMKWSKMFTNLIANASSAILDMTPAEIFSNPISFHIELMQLRETLQVMQAWNIPVTDLPGTPVRLLAWVVRSLPAGVSRPLLANAVGKGRGGKMPSFHIDLHKNHSRSEVDYLNGAVVRFGERKGIPTPANKILCNLVSGLSRAEIPLTTFACQPEKLLEQIEQDHS